MKSVRKNLAINEGKKLIIFISMLTMMAGLLFSRGLLSSGLIVFAAVCLIHKNIYRQLKKIFSSPLLWITSLLFALPLISGLWSEDLSRWSQILRIKLPLFLLPVCFAGLDNFTFKDWEKIAFSFLTLMVGGVCWSLLQYLQDANSIDAGYLRAHTIETPLGNDHVRFSLLIAIGIITSIFLLLRTRRKKIVVILLLTVTTGLVIYLHVLAVRTGLLCFYIGVFVFTGWLAWNHRHKTKYALLLLLVLLLPIISWFIFPTFKNRVSYLKYDLSFVRKNTYVQGSNDGNRLISLKAGWQLQNQHPLTGVGFGDIKNETNKFYEANYPQMKEEDKILPSGEWAIYGAGTGWPGFILFSLIMLAPFFINGLRKNIAWWLLNIFILLSYLFDIGLEVQYGVFIHAFVLLWWYKWLLEVP
jgi:O-antigen ligase